MNTITLIAIGVVIGVLATCAVQYERGRAKGRLRRALVERYHTLGRPMARREDMPYRPVVRMERTRR